MKPREPKITQEIIDRAKFNLRFAGITKVASDLNISTYTVSNIKKGNYDTGKLKLNDTRKLV